MLYTTVAAGVGPGGDAWVADGKELPAPTTARVVYDPAAALREVAALRAILRLHAPTQPHPEFGFTYPAAAKFCGYDGPGDTWQAEQEPEYFPDALWPCRTVRLLVSIWSGHPDYRPEWKP